MTSTTSIRLLMATILSFLFFSVGAQPQLPRDKKPVEIPPLTHTETTPTDWEILVSLSKISGKSVGALKDLHYTIRDIEKVHGIPAAVTWALVWIESDKLRSDLAKRGNNYTGMKAKPGWTGATICNDHNEYYSAKKTWKKQNACFKSYPSAKACLNDFANHLKTKKWYADAFECGSDDPECWIYGLSKQHDIYNIGYATDPDWADKIIRIMRDYDFIHF